LNSFGYRPTTALAEGLAREYAWITAVVASPAGRPDRSS
jgi:broad specificity phosphatase PhoE